MILVYWKNGLYIMCVVQKESSIFKTISSSQFTIRKEKLKLLKLVEGRGSWVGDGMSGQAQRGPPRPQPLVPYHQQTSLVLEGGGR
jgi:hypothetical protein